MPHHAVDPAAGGAACGVEGHGALPDADEGVVENVLGILALPHDAQRHAEEVTALALVDPRECLPVSLGAGEERGFIVEIFGCL